MSAFIGKQEQHYEGGGIRMDLDLADEAVHTLRRLAGRMATPCVEAIAGIISCCANTAQGTSASDATGRNAYQRSEDPAPAERIESKRIEATKMIPRSIIL